MYKMHYTLVLLATSLLSAGCVRNVPETWPYAEQPRDGEVNGKGFCSKLERGANDYSIGNAVGGWIFAGLAAGSATAGTIVTTANAASEGGGNKGVGIAGAALIASSALMLPAALAFFSRGDAATELGAEANRAILEDTDRKAYDRCVTAKASWIASRSEATAIAKDALQKALKDKKEAETKASTATAEAEKSKEKATDEKSKADAQKKEAETKAAEAAAAKKRADDADEKLRKVREALSPKKNAVPPAVWEMLQQEGR